MLNTTRPTPIIVNPTTKGTVNTSLKNNVPPVAAMMKLSNVNG
jgi:hypothetical protein